ncbi:MAG: heavy-metal-associated domain-containing protein [Clostridia bacterium]|nr:heavy-metal-associated domain-containing protein [Clostridia bacterium]MBQ6707972.1 heavy-metal-associated domain-containing protein [Clostridia bacterium]
MIKIILTIEGMACNMCEAHMNDAVRKVFDVKKVTSSHKDKETVIISENDIEDEKLKELVLDTGYELKDIRREPYEKKGLFSFLKK